MLGKSCYKFSVVFRAAVDGGQRQPRLGVPTIASLLPMLYTAGSMFSVTGDTNSVTEFEVEPPTVER